MFSVEISFSLFQPRQEKISGGETLIKINESTQELRAWVKLTHEIIECDSCNINKVKRRKKVIETSQSDLIWLDHFCTISSKKSQENWARDSLYYLGYSYLLFLCYDSAESVEIKKKNRKKICKNLILEREESENRCQKWGWGERGRLEVFGMKDR